MPTMIVLVNLKDDVTPEEYERWLDEHYLPAVLELDSVDAWHGYRVGGLAEAGGEPPHDYIVSVEVNDLEQLARDIEGGRMQTLLGELGRYAEVTQLMTERFV
ncbi:MAG: hypothetical protein ACRDTR_00915 [Rubrobacter sp.]